MAGNQLDKAAVLAAVSEFNDPETGRSVVETGQVRDVAIDGQAIRLTLALSTHSAILSLEARDRLTQLLKSRFGDADVTVESANFQRPAEKIGQIGLAGQKRRRRGLGQGGRGQEHDRGQRGPRPGARPAATWD